MKFAQICISVMLVLIFLTTVAGAETFSGKVTARRSVEVYAPIGGTVETVNVRVGQMIEEDDSIASLEVTYVYAPEDGKVTGIFAEPGDNAETVAAKYGSVMSIEGDNVYTVLASVENAYNTTSTKFVHVGEKVYISCYSDNTHTGTGIITEVQGTDYTVEVLSGSFLIPETVNIYRGSSAVSSRRIGRGTLNRKASTAVSASGSIVSIEVENGDEVIKGQLLMTTLNGTFDGYYMSGTDIVSDIAGTVASVNVSQGSKVEKGSVAAVVYPEGETCVQAEISEYDLGSIHVGDTVSIELLWNQDTEVTYEGTVAMISAVASSSGNGESDTTYTVYIDFTPDENTRYGMSAVITTMDELEYDGYDEDEYGYDEDEYDCDGDEEVEEDAEEESERGVLEGNEEGRSFPGDSKGGLKGEFDRENMSKSRSETSAARN